MKLSEVLEQMEMPSYLSERARRLESIAKDHWMSEALRWGATYDRSVAWAEKRLEDINKS